MSSSPIRRRNSLAGRRAHFQLEVGFHDGAWGILGFLCIWIGGLFWLATGLGWSFFMLGATYGHIRETVIGEDYAPYNFFTMFSDGFIGIWILVLFYLYWRQGGCRKEGDEALLIGLPQAPLYPIYSSGRLAAGAFLANRVRSGRKQP
jgi:Family of unknown function (DUF6790)